MSSGTSSGSSLGPNSGSEEEELIMKAMMDQKKRKRMQSNRESARRSRMRKQKHLDDLMAQVSQLRKENGEILTALNITTQQYLGVEAQNSVLRTQHMELTTRLHSLNDILRSMNPPNSTHHCPFNDAFISPWSATLAAASIDMFQYC